MCGDLKARGRLEGNSVPGISPLLSGPLVPDPALHPGSYSARPAPRINPNATHILERGQRGVVGSLLTLEGVSLTPQPKPSKGNADMKPFFINVNWVFTFTSLLLLIEINAHLAKQHLSFWI